MTDLTLGGFQSCYLQRPWGQWVHEAERSNQKVCLFATITLPSPLPFVLVGLAWMTFPVDCTTQIRSVSIQHPSLVTPLIHHFTLLWVCVHIPLHKPSLRHSICNSPSSHLNHWAPPQIAAQFVRIGCGKSLPYSANKSSMCSCLQRGQFRSRTNLAIGWKNYLVN